MLQRRILPQLNDRCYYSCILENKNRLQKRLFLTLQSLLIMVVITTRNISGYSTLGALRSPWNKAVSTTATLAFAPSPKIKSSTAISSRMPLRYSSSLIQRFSESRSLQKQWRLYWKPNDAGIDTYRWQQHRQNIMSSSTFRTTGTTTGITSVIATIPATQLQVHTNMRDADIVEMLIGGERYSLVPMPHAMKATTIFVGNICEFVQDSDLSTYFSQVSSLTSVPSCVVRKVDTQSMGYGFVSFPNVDEKEVSYFGVRDQVDMMCSLGLMEIPTFSLGGNRTFSRFRVERKTTESGSDT